MERVKLVVRPRPEVGTRPSRRLRRQGIIPGILYGSGKEAQPFAVDERHLREALTTEAGLHAILDVTFEGKKRPHIAILKAHQLDATRHVVTHVDLQEIRLDEPIESTVAIVVEGTSVGVKQGGLLDMLTHEVAVHGLPADIPEHVTLDVTSLGIGDHGRVADLVVPGTITVVDDAEHIICSVLAPRVVEVAEGEEAAAEAAAAEPGLVGEEAEAGADQGEA
ncbi:MAG TPA: 50S ribosomal protein L25 [Thermoleophilia bacterium]|nr:50S ribosomal protein L25 [Thermoleophilia bacterium]